jgi:hypothetical protein
MEKENELLYGDPGKHLIRLAAPLIVGNILQQFYNTFDVFVVGRFAGQNEYAALGVAGSLMNLFLFALAGMCTGMLVLLARSRGAGNMADFRRHALLLPTEEDKGMRCLYDSRERGNVREIRRCEYPVSWHREAMLAASLVSDSVAPETIL